MLDANISNESTPMPTPQFRVIGRVYQPRRFFQHITSQYEEIVR